MLDALEPAFAVTEGWQRVYPDLPGCGASTGFDEVRSQDDVLTEILRFADETFGARAFAVIGESRGSYLAQGLAYRRPGQVRGLCLIVPGGDSAEAKAQLPEPAALIADPDLIAGLTSELRTRAERLVVQTEAVVGKIRETKLPAAALHDAALEARVAERFFFSFHDAMRSTIFKEPSLVISGRQDSIAGYEDAIAMLPQFPRATYALLDCAGHSLSWERPELFAALLRDWLERLSRT